jgi:D-alanyl-D-alanine carboxypeptidase
MRKIKINKKTTIIVIVLLIVIGLAVTVFAISNKPDSTEANTTDTSIESDSAGQGQDVADTTPAEPEEEPVDKPATPTPPPTDVPKWPIQLTTSQASSITVIVNKKHKLPSTYVPSLTNVSGGQLRTEAAAALNNLLAAAKSSGLNNMKYVSGYRSYNTQQTLYNNYVARDGQAAADTYSARPGHSEHQTGLAVDVGNGGGCDLEICFADTAEGKWVANNAYKYGFVVRYPKGKESITGYQYEPWHLRYLGVAEATAVFNSGKTLEEYYNIPGGGY